MALNLKKPTPKAEGTAETPARAPMIHRSNGNQKLTSTFARASTPVTHRLIVNAEGEEKSGKNHFSFSAPGPIFLHSFDIGNEGVVQKFQDQKEIYIAEYALSLQPNEASAGEVAEAADKVLQQFVSNYRDGLASCGNGTTVCDTATELWALVRLSRFGRLTQVMPHHYGPVNKEMQELVREGYNHDCNVILIHQLKDEWENYQGSDGKEKGRKTGRKTRVGFGDIPYLVQLNVRCERIDQDGGGSEFQIAIEDCRQNPDLNNTTLPNDFEMLLSMVFGG